MHSPLQLPLQQLESITAKLWQPLKRQSIQHSYTTTGIRKMSQLNNYTTAQRRRTDCGDQIKPQQLQIGQVILV